MRLIRGGSLNRVSPWNALVWPGWFVLSKCPPPLAITDRGKPAHVLLSIEDYRRLAGQGRSLAEALSMPGLADIDFDPPGVRIEAPPPDLS